MHVHTSSCLPPHFCSLSFHSLHTAHSHSTLLTLTTHPSLHTPHSYSLQPQSRQSEGCWLDTMRQQECHYYLQTYGTQLQHIHFLWRHGFLEAACKLIIDEGLPTDVFLEGLYVPCLKNGTIQKLEGIMLTRDCSLHVWEPHLLAACRYFNSRSLFHILYHIQLFMKVCACVCTNLSNTVSPVCLCQVSL